MAQHDSSLGPFWDEFSTAASAGAMRLIQQTNTTDSSDDDSKSGQEIAGAVLSNVFLFLLIFGMSATVDCKNLKRQLSNKFAICTGVAMQFLIMPALGYLAVTIFDGSSGFTEAMGITLLVITASPGGSYSNWWCCTFNADLALSVAMTTVSSILSLGLLPANLFLYTYLAYGNVENDEGESVIQALDFGTIFITLGIVLFAICSGLVAGYKFDTHAFHVASNRLGSISGLLLVLFSIFLSSGADGAESKAWNQDWEFYLAVALPCLAGIALSNIIARSVNLTRPETVAISIECCYQNTAIATSVAITMFSDTEDRAQAVAVPLFYGIVEAVVIGAYCVWAWKAGWTKAPADENLCIVISKTYELKEDESPISQHEDDDNEQVGEVQQEDECNVEDGVCRDEVIPATVPRRSFFARLFGRQQQEEIIEIEPKDLKMNHGGDGDEITSAEKPEAAVESRTQTETDFTAENSLASLHRVVAALAQMTQQWSMILLGLHRSQ